MLNGERVAVTNRLGISRPTTVKCYYIDRAPTKFGRQPHKGCPVRWFHKRAVPIEDATFYVVSKDVCFEDTWVTGPASNRNHLAFVSKPMAQRYGWSDAVKVAKEINGRIIPCIS